MYGICNICGRIELKRYLYATGGRAVCQHCKQHLAACNDCGTLHLHDALTAVLNSSRTRVVCPTCMHRYSACAICGTYVRIVYEGNHWINHLDRDRELICDNCYQREHYTTCTECGNTLPESMVAARRNTHVICNDCYTQETHHCNHCGRTMALREGITDSADGLLCYRCSHYYRYCDRCGRFISTSDYNNTPLCSICLDNEQRQAESEIIRAYNYRPPSINFFGEDTTFYGVEWEIAHGGEDGRKAKKLIDIIGHNKAYVVHDGSVYNGIEVVTMPCTLDYHRNDFPWQAVTSKAKNMGYRSDESCGLHIHVNRSAFASDLHTLKTIYVVDSCYELTKSISGRTERDLERWAKPYNYDIKHCIELTPPTHVMRNLLDTEDSEDIKYMSVNLLHKNTIEFRIFTGSMDHNVIVGCIEYIDFLISVTRHTPFKVLGSNGSCTPALHCLLLKHQERWPLLFKLYTQRCRIPNLAGAELNNWRVS